MDFVAIAVHSRGRTDPPSFFFSPRGSLPAYPRSAAAIAVNGHGSIPNRAALPFFSRTAALSFSRFPSLSRGRLPIARSSRSGLGFSRRRPLVAAAAPSSLLLPGTRMSGGSLVAHARPGPGPAPAADPREAPAGEALRPSPRPLRGPRRRQRIRERRGQRIPGGRSCTSPPPPSPRDPAGRKGSTPRSLSSSSSDPQGDGPTAWSKRRVPRGRIWGRKGARQQPASGSRRRRRKSQGAGTVQWPGGWEARAGDDGRAASMRW